MKLIMSKGKYVIIRTLEDPRSIFMWMKEITVANHERDRPEMLCINGCQLKILLQVSKLDQLTSFLS